jgi:3-hydroxybutyrate dehydrogenase
MSAVRFDFSGERVLVTGASRGIGYGVAEAFVRAGAEVYILAETGNLDAVARQLMAIGGRPVTALEADITDRDALHRVLAPLDRIDVLVNNAGLERLTPIAEPGGEVEATFRRIIDVNINGTYAVTRECLPKMRSGGRIIVTASIWGKTAEAGFAAYVASKHALIGFTRTLAKELGPAGIRVNAVCPGWVRTEASLRSAGVLAARDGTSLEAVIEGVLAHQAIGGLMEPADVAGLYLFLASDAAGSITGQSVTIDRGETLQ